MFLSLTMLFTGNLSLILFWILNITTALSDYQWVIETNSSKIDAFNIFKSESYPEMRYNDTAFINLSDSGSLTYIDPNTFDRFTKLTKVVMDRSRYYNFPAEKPLLIHTKINTYHCNGCLITRIYNRTFAELPELSMLSLSDNNISYISPHAFVKTPKLNYLDLQSNNLRHINDHGYLHQLQNIGYLLLSGNNEFQFMNNRSLTARSETLRVFKCETCSIEDACVIFKSYPKIFELKLSNNRLQSFNCSEAKSVKDITLSGNDIQELRLAGNKLEYFSCVGCSITNISRDMFKNAPKLEFIDLSHNGIEHIAADSFIENNLLKHLNVENNRISNISLEFLDSMPNLQSLCLDENNFCPSYDNSLFKADYIKRNLRGQRCYNSENPFENSLPDMKSPNSTILCEKRMSLTRSITLDTLDLSYQDIGYITSDYLENTENIKVLNISNNYALTLHDEIFLIHSFLQELDMSSCAVTNIYKENFAGLPKLLKINLSNNKIKFIASYSFTVNEELEDLILDDNEIEFLSSDTLKGTPKLTRLSLNHNRNLDFEEYVVFLDHSVLQELFCDYCGVHALFKETFSKMPNLRKLTLAFNAIKKINDNSFLHNKYLSYLNLDGNMLKSFDVKIVRGLTELKYLCLDYNEDFNYTNSKSNRALQEFYVTKKLRHVSCEAEDDDDYFENRLKIVETSQNVSIKVLEESTIELRKETAVVPLSNPEPTVTNSYDHITEKNMKNDDDSDLQQEEPSTPEITLKTAGFGNSGDKFTPNCFKFVIILLFLMVI